MHELCYAISREPTKGFTYGGVIVSNCDLHIASYKPSAMPMAYGANNHGSIVRIGKDWYIFTIGIQAEHGTVGRDVQKK